VSLSAEDSASFRDVLARYATGVVVVTTRIDGVDHAMTANSFTSVSLEPPLVLVCVTRDTRFRAAMGDGDQPWAVSILGERAREAARWFATRGRPLQGQFADVAHHRGTNGAILLDDALGYVECQTESLYPGGDHDILVGRVTALALGQPAALDQSPLVFFEHGFMRLASDG